MARGKRGADAGPIEGPWGLPEGWRWEPMETAAAVNPSRAFDKIPAEAEVTFVPMAAVEELTGHIDTSRMRAVGSVKSGYTRFRSGDVIFAKITPCMENGKIAVVPPLPYGMGAGSTEFHVLEPTVVGSEWIYYFLSQRIFRQNAEHHMTGTAGQKRVPTPWLRRSPIPIPPSRKVEAAIIARLEELLEEIDDGGSSLSDARESAHLYRRVVLRDAANGNLTAKWRADRSGGATGEALLKEIEAERTAKGHKFKTREPRSEPTRQTVLPKGWVWASLEDLSVEPPRNGLSIKAADGESEVRGLRLDALAGDTIDWSRTRPLPRTLAEVAPFSLRDGDLLVSRANGSPDLVGKASLCVNTPADVIFPDTAFRFRLGGPSALTKWVLRLWNSEIVRAQLSGLTKSTAGILKVSQSDLRQVAIPIPGMVEIERALELLEASLQKGQIAAEAARDCTGAAEDLRQAVLAAAFRGDLLTQRAVET